MANYDMLVHPRDNELVIGTHGRSVYIMDVKPLQALKDGKFNQSITAFNPTQVNYNQNWGTQTQAYIPVKQPKVDLLYYIGQASTEPVRVEILNKNKEVIRKLSGTANLGFQSVTWDLKTESAKDLGKKKSATLPVDYAKPGTYTIKFILGKTSAESAILIK